MSIASGYISAFGEKFSPKKAEEVTGLVFFEKNEPGDIGKRGKYRGKPTPYGSGSVDIPQNSTTADLLPQELGINARQIEQLRKCGATNITLNVQVGYSDQCNLELSPDLLTRLAALGVTLGISCYQKAPG